MNIINRKTAACDKDPFHQSDRVSTGPGKGDKNRSIGTTFTNNFPPAMGKHRCKPGKTVYRYRR